MQYAQTDLGDTILFIDVGKADATDILEWIIAHQKWEGADKKPTPREIFW